MRKMVAGLAVAAIVAVAIGMFAISERDPFPVVPLPKLGDGPITLRVVRAINDRLDALTEAEFESALEQTARMVQDHFGLEVRFERGVDYEISDLMALLPAAAKKVAEGKIYNLPDPIQEPNRLAAMIELYLDQPEIDPGEIADYVAPFIPRAPAMNTQELALALARVWVKNLRRWHELQAQDMEPVINYRNYHQLAFWFYLGYGELPFDIVITNQLLASAELFVFSRDVPFGGGKTGGFALFSRLGQFDSYAMASTFSAVNNLGNVNELGFLSELGPNQITHDPDQYHPQPLF